MTENELYSDYSSISPDELKKILFDELNKSFEDFTKLCYETKSGKFCKKLGSDIANNRFWYDQFIKLIKNNKYRKYNEYKYNSKTKYSNEYINEWKKMGCFPTPENKNKNCLDRNAARGVLDYTEYLINNGINPDELTLSNAIKSGNEDLVNKLIYILLQISVVLDINQLDELAQKGLLNSLIYLIGTTGILPQKSTLDAAALSGNTNLYNYLINQYNLNPDLNTLNMAVSSSNIDLIKSILSNNIELVDNSITYYIDNIEILKYLVSIGISPDENTLNSASRKGNIELVKYLIKNYKFKPNEYTLNSAALSGNIGLVKYLIENYKFKPNEYTLNSTALSGNVELVKYLIENYKFTPDENTLNSAVLSGNVELVKYLIENSNIFPDKNTLNSAVLSGNIELVKYLSEYLPENLLKNLNDSGDDNDEDISNLNDEDISLEDY